MVQALKLPFEQAVLAGLEQHGTALCDIEDGKKIMPDPAYGWLYDPLREIYVHKSVVTDAWKCVKP